MADHHGLFTRTHALECGFSGEQLRGRLARGEWRRVLGPVFAAAGTPETIRIRDLAAQLAIPGAVLSGPSAGRLYGFDPPDARTCVTVPRHRRSRLPGVRLLREPLGAEDVRVTDGILVTSPRRAVFDCLRLLPEPEARRLLDRALLLGWTALDDLASRTRAHVGRHGAPKLAKLIGEASTGARSAAERVFLRLLRTAGLAGWHANYRVTVRGQLLAVVDVAFPACRVAIEIDGWAYHHLPDRFQNDRTRQNRLAAAGWTVLRFTWSDLVDRPADVIRIVTQLVRSRTA